MKSDKFYLLAVTALILLLGYLTYQILKPFLSPIAWAVVLSIVFYPLYIFVLRYVKWKSAASLITLIAILLIIVGPFSYFSYALVDELKNLSDYMEKEKIYATKDLLHHPYLQSLFDKIIATFNITEAELDQTISESVSKFGKDLIVRITSGLGDILNVAINFLFMAFSIFFILKDGPDFLKKFRDYMPFSEEQDDRLVAQMKDIIVSTIYGGVAVAIIQGIIGGTAFYFLGFSSPVLWGLSISIASFIPLVGAFAVWGPAAAYLFIKGAILNGIILSVIGMFGISLIDNILRPIFIGSRIKMPVLVIFFSVLGGIKLFGLIGLIMGPLVLALFVSVIEIFRNIEGEQNV